MTLNLSDFQKLTGQQQQEVNDFIAYLLSKKQSPDTGKKTNYKDLIKNVSVWTAEEGDLIDPKRKKPILWDA